MACEIRARSALPAREVVETPRPSLRFVAIDVEPETFVTREEAADLLGCSVRSVDRLRARGRLSAVQFLRRGRVRYRRHDVESLLEPEARDPARGDELLWR